MIAQFIGIIALNFILFSGGLDTDWQSVKPVLWQGISLSTLGVILTAFTVGTFVWAITDFTIYEGLLLGSVSFHQPIRRLFSQYCAQKAWPLKEIYDLPLNLRVVAMIPWLMSLQSFSPDWL
jgi:hypothetical protein